MQAHKLRIRMMKAAEIHIDMTFAASVTEFLPLFVPPLLRKKLDRRSIHLPAIATEARSRNHVPRHLLHNEAEEQAMRT